MDSPCVQSTAAGSSISWAVRPFQGTTFRQEDHRTHAGGPLLTPSGVLFRLSLTFILVFLFLLHHHRRGRCSRWCTAAGEIRQGPPWMVGFTGVYPLGWWGGGGGGLDAATELLKRVLCEETHISKQTSAFIPGDNRGNTRCSSHFLSDLPLEPEPVPTGESWCRVCFHSRSNRMHSSGDTRGLGKKKKASSRENPTK